MKFLNTNLKIYLEFNIGTATEIIFKLHYNQYTVYPNLDNIFGVFTFYFKNSVFFVEKVYLIFMNYGLKKEE